MCPWHATNFRKGSTFDVHADGRGSYHEGELAFGRSTKVFDVQADGRGSYHEGELAFAEGVLFFDVHATTKRHDEAPEATTRPLICIFDLLG